MKCEVHLYAVEEIYIANQAWLKKWLKTKIRDSNDEISDIAHDVFVRVLGSGQAQRIQEPKNYLSKIAKGLVIDRFRRRAIEQAYIESIANHPLLETPSEEERHIIIEKLIKIESMLHSLPTRTREIFIMSNIEGLPYRDISLKLGISMKTISKHNKSALVKFALTAI
ncbi:sigma-70 family RNA polymerase sigma factor [Pseudomonas aeruginosa]|uniref:sigma-70 family RNA polymerase sigma factor n=1 Tax=Pseudomonas aeruginosa TaxID=287 RepID=UPI0034D1D247